MSADSPVMAIVALEADAEFARSVTTRSEGAPPHIVVATPAGAISEFTKRTASPEFLLIDIGEAGPEILSEIDAIAEYCEMGTRVVVLGHINDVGFYRMLKERGVSEYFTKPAKAADIKNVLFQKPATPGGGIHRKGQVIPFISAASGDGASTVALNTAYALAVEHNKSVVLVDMDYQFGMIAKSLDMTTQFGIKELFDNPDRGIDSTLIERMILSYKGTKLKIIAAPNQLNYIPNVPDSLISHLIATLTADYDFVIIDLPHLWSPIVGSALLQSNHIVMVAQLLLRSITHASRLLNTLRKIDIRDEQISLVANRSGAKFKEAVSSADFERVCSLKFAFHFGNDTKSVIAAENNGRTILEGAPCELSKQFRKFSSSYTRSPVAAEKEKLGNTSLPKRLADLMGGSGS